MSKRLLVLLTLIGFGLTGVVSSAVTSKKDPIKDAYVKHHIGLADVLSQARVKNRTCELEAYVTTIIDHIRDAATQSENKVSVPPVVENVVKHSLQYREITGEMNAFSGKGVAEALSKSKFYGPSFGVYGHSKWIEFKADGKLIYHEAKEIGIWSQYQGEWGYLTPTAEKSYDGIVIIRLNKPEGSKTLVYRLKKFWSGGYSSFVLTLGKKKRKGYSNKPVEWKDIKFYNENPSECDA